MVHVPWHTSRNQNTNGNDKSNLVKPQNWFSRSGAEPSRRAFTDLVRKHERDESVGSGHSKSASRSSSNPLVDGRFSTSSTRSSRPPTSYKDNRSQLNSNIASGSLFERGARMIRKTGSRMSLTSGSSSVVSRPSTPATLRSNTPSLSQMTTNSLHAYISRPYGFQHITHTERADLRDFEPSTAELSPPAPLPKDSPVQNTSPSETLPPSPGRPSGMSRNLSYDTDTMNTELGGHLSDSNSQLMSSALPPFSLMNSKPLPTLPIVHAITTDDDSARHLITLPLPTPPIHKTTFDRSHDSPRSRTGHAHDIAHSSLTSSPTNLTATERSTPQRNFSNLKYRSNHCIISPLQSHPRTTFSMVDDVDWEAAIDEAWDLADDGRENDSAQTLTPSVPSWRSSPSCGGNEEVSTNASSLVSTPITCSAPVESGLGKRTHELLEDSRRETVYSQLSGLGIDSPSHTILSLSPRISNLNHNRQSFSGTNDGDLTSKESLILSLASSIAATDRSSKSSVNSSELLQTLRGEKIDEVGRPRPESGCLPIEILAEMSSTRPRRSKKQPVLSYNSPNIHSPRDELDPQAGLSHRPFSMATSPSGAVKAKGRANTLVVDSRPSSTSTYSLFPIPPGHLTQTPITT